MAQDTDDAGENGSSGVFPGSPASLFENDELDTMLAEAAPFKVMPIGRGRPKGAPNKRTAQMRELYLKAFPHPMLQAGSILRMTIDELSRELMCSRYEAAELQRKTRADLMPYLESKMPVAVDLGAQEGLPVLVVHEFEGGARQLRQAQQAGAMSIDGDLVEAMSEDEEKQRLESAAKAGSHASGSHCAAQGADANGESGSAATD